MKDLTILEMMEVDPPTARKNDPQTSKDAALKIKYKGLRHAILQEIAKTGYYGATSFEVAERMKLPRDNVSPNFKPLERGGWLERTGLTRINRKTRSKCANEVWIVTA